MTKFEKMASVFAMVAMGAFLTALFTITATYQDETANLVSRAYLGLDLMVSTICLVASGVCLLVAKFTGK
jgi:hypothetical protein